MAVFGQKTGYGKRIMSERFTKERYFEGMAASVVDNL